MKILEHCPELLKIRDVVEEKYVKEVLIDGRFDEVNYRGRVLRKNKRYSPDEVFRSFKMIPNLIAPWVLDEDPISENVNNRQTIYTFYAHGTRCVQCGIEGQFFIKEKNVAYNDTEKYVLNLYALGSNGEEILINKDHIVPRSFGGSNVINNLQPMCAKCNIEKGNKIDKTIIQGDRIFWAIANEYQRIDNQIPSIFTTILVVIELLIVTIMNRFSIRFKGKADSILLEAIVCILGVYYQRYPYAQNKDIKSAIIETIEHAKPLKSNPIFVFKQTERKSKKFIQKICYQMRKGFNFF
ncbi:HNH endonuclease [Sporomusa ovata DSM 2662]|uniref:Putative HNH endonuclease n=1 Tax=Sporomusa ovata TaxID=2378 RepID=A0A0U1L4U5_9FIRM|nr:HNH endonuclease [Sporomusa ovata]EQB25340.1 restriction endonuclease [Sporomusa ovata DSM 2662]CQR73904.1 putative HNH endonuclease [Sporomusa ovata]